MSKLIKKAFTVSVVLTTIVWSIGLFAMPISVLAAGSGDLIKKADSSSVYYLGADGKRYVFPSDRVFFTWYDDFSTIQILSDTEVESYPLGGNVTAKPGVKLVQAVTNDTPWQVADPKVYAVAGNGTLRHVTSAAVAEELYGADWESMILPVVETVFVGYSTGDDITAAADFDKDAETAAATSINDDKDLSAAEGGTLLTCALAADTPASGIVVPSAARFPFTYIDCTASADGDITIDSMVIQRTGVVAQDGAFSSIAIIDRDTNEQIGLNKTLNANHQATLNDDIVVSAGTTKRLSLAGNMASSLTSYAGEIPSLSLVTITLKDSATLDATLPITGNYQTINSTVTVASGTLGTGASNPTSDSAPEIGKENVNFTEIKISNTSSSANNPSGLKIRQVKWTQNGSASDSDLENIDFVDQDGTVLATSSQVDKKVYFKFAEGSEPTINAGQNRSYMVRGDVVDGSGRTVSMDIKNYTDILMWDPDHSVYITLTAGTGAQSSTPRINGTDQTIGAGTLKVEPASISSSNITEGGTQVVLGAFKFTVKGEPVEITQIGWQTHIDAVTAGLGATTSDITNLTIYDPDGNVVAGPMDPTHDYGDGDEAYGSATTTDTITVPVGETVYTVKADLSTDFANNDTIDVRVTPAANITATGSVSGDSITATPSGVQTSVTQTIKTGSLNVSLSPDPIAQSVVAGTLDHIFAYINLDASGSGEDVKVSQIAVSVKPTTASADELSNLRLFDGDTQLAVSNDPDSGLSSTAGTASTSTFTLSESLLITKGTTKTLAVKANISKSTSAGDIFKIGIHSPGVSATGADTGNSITPNYNQSDGNNQTIVANGTLSLTKGSSSPKSGLIPGGTAGQTVGVMSATAQYEDIKIEKIYLTAAQVNSGGWDQIDKLYLYDGSTLITSVTPTATDAANRTVLIDVTADPLVVPKDSTKDYTLKVDTSAVNYFTGSKGASAQGFQLKINAAADVTAKGAESSASVTPNLVPTFNSFTLYKSVPTVATNEDLGADKVSSGTLNAGTESSKDLYKFKVTADSAGDVALYSVSYLISTSTATVTGLTIYDGTENVAATTTQRVHITDGASGSDTMMFTFLFTDDGLVPDSGRTNVVPYTVSAGTSKSFTLRGDVTCGLDGVDCSGSSGSGSVSVQLLGDGAVPGTNPDQAKNLEVLNYEANFIWGDLWRTLNTSSQTASSAEQWTNGYLVAKAGGGTLQPTSTAVSFTR